jgi:hypothetical protein
MTWLPSTNRRQPRSKVTSSCLNLSVFAPLNVLFAFNSTGVPQELLCFNEAGVGISPNFFRQSFIEASLEATRHGDGHISKYQVDRRNQ